MSLKTDGDFSADFFFNKPDFVYRIPGREILAFPQNAAKPLIYFTSSGEELVSLEKSPFGSFTFIDKTTTEDLIKTCDEFLQWATANRIKLITIRCFPEIYAPEQSLIATQVLKKASFSILYKDVTQVIGIDKNKPLVISIHKRRRLRKCIELGFQFKEIDTDLLPAAYALFTESRKNKKYPVTMTLEDFETAFRLFPDAYLLFGVFDGNKLIAASVSVKVNQKILYNFFSGDSLEYRVYSPVTQLLYGIYEYGLEKKMKFIDLGISTDKGVMNVGLHSFKKSMGALDVFKFTFQRKL
jgi:hypothetical protein